MEREILECYGDVIKEVEYFQITEKYGLKILKMVVRLVDGSSLRIWEKRSRNSLERYSY